MMKQKPYLEPIQEESEQESEIERSTMAADEEVDEEEDSQIQQGVETKELTTEDESEEEDDNAPLRVLRPRRLSRYLSQESSPQMQFTNNHQEETRSLSVSHTEDVSDEAVRPDQARSGKERGSRSGGLSFKLSKVRWQKYTAAKPPEKKLQSRKRKKSPKPFPAWLVGLMVNIEEATTHQLVVE